jgi:hypothetical protein
MSFKEFTIDNVTQGSLKNNELSDEPLFDIFLDKPKQIIEACGYDTTNNKNTKYIKNIGNNLHAFVDSILYAFNNHLPLTLEPDDFWQLIMEAVSRHVNLNSAVLRKKYVDFDGKIELIVKRNGFIKGKRNNDWPSVFSEFKDQISSNTKKDVYELLINNPKFTTSTPISLITRNISLMDTCQQFFDYTVFTMCGFPKIKLFGTLEDWKNLRKCASDIKSIILPEFADLWLGPLDSILEKIVLTYQEEDNSKIDKLFWGSMVKYDSSKGSGENKSWISGWINTFFPYDQNNKFNSWTMTWPDLCTKQKEISDKKNPNANYWDDIRIVNGMLAEGFPKTFSSAPVKWNYLGNIFSLTFKAGTIGATQDVNTLEVKPGMGWAVIENID